MLRLVNVLFALLLCAGSPADAGPYQLPQQPALGECVMLPQREAIRMLCPSNEKRSTRTTKP